MKNFLILVALVFVGVAAWRMGDFISHDAITMAIGFLFGVIAGLPVALIMLASQRRREPDYNGRRDEYPRQAQPQIFVLGGAPQPYHQPHQAQPPAWPTGGGSYNMLGGPQDGRFGEAEARRKWGER